MVMHVTQLKLDLRALRGECISFGKVEDDVMEVLSNENRGGGNRLGNLALNSSRYSRRALEGL